MVMSGRRGRSEREELLRALFLVLLFFVLMVGREIGDIYQGHQEVSKLSVLLQVGEEELAGFIDGVLKGEDSDLPVGIALTLPSVSNVEGVVTQLPDYARRWMISVFLSPVVVRQPEVSDIEVWLLVEGEEVHYQMFEFRRERVSYLSYLERNISLTIMDIENFRDAVDEAARLHGGEVMVTLEGRANTHMLFLESWLPGSTTRYPLIRLPHLEHLSSHWSDLEGQRLSRVGAGQGVIVELRVRNPTRVHSLYENVTVTVYGEGSEEATYSGSKLVGVAPGTEATYTLPVELNEPGVYRYSLSVEGGLEVPVEGSPQIEVVD
jgi:hypothetical protein